MKKSFTIKFSLFAFLSAIICYVGSFLLPILRSLYLPTCFFFLAYLFFMMWISQLVYGKTSFRINWVVLIMSFSMSVYFFIMYAITQVEFLSECYLLAFYLLIFLCIVSSIILIGRVIFSSPEKKISTQKLPQPHLPTVSTSSWICSCGATNTGKFCSECGKPNIVSEDPQDKK